MKLFHPISSIYMVSSHLSHGLGCETRPRVSAIHSAKPWGCLAPAKITLTLFCLPVLAAVLGPQGGGGGPGWMQSGSPLWEVGHMAPWPLDLTLSRKSQKYRIS